MLLSNILHGHGISSLLGEDTVAEEVTHEVKRLFRSIGKGFAQYGLAEEENVFPFWVPGRLEILGKHTDYAGGESVLAALNRGFALVAHANKGDRLLIFDAESRQEIRVNLATSTFSSPFHWGVYVRTLINRMCSNFGPLRQGATIGLASNLPTAAGMSSSSALVSGLFLALAKLNSLENSPSFQENIQSNLDLSDYLGHIENGQTYKALVGDKGVGTLGGSQDHAAILCSKARTLRVFSFVPTRLVDEVSLPKDHCFVIASSGRRAEKTRNARKRYNRCATLARKVLECTSINPDGDLVTMGQLVQQSGFNLDEACTRLKKWEDGPELVLRLIQFNSETRNIIPAFVQALKSNALAELGDLVDQSQMLAASHLKNQVPETVHLAQSARSLGAIASSAFGAGFGGSVWALTEIHSAREFTRRWQREYEKAFPQWTQYARFFIDYTGNGALTER